MHVKSYLQKLGNPPRENKKRRSKNAKVKELVEMDFLFTQKVTLLLVV